MTVSVTELTAELPAGITLNATNYPGANDALLAVIDVLDAFDRAQTTNNATAPAGQAVASVARAVGPETTVTIPGVGPKVVRTRTYTVSLFEESAVTTVYPVQI